MGAEVGRRSEATGNHAVRPHARRARSGRCRNRVNDVLRASHLIALLLPALLTGLAGPVGASELQQPLVKREILALYDGAREGAADATRIHRFAELPLNHLGYILHYHDVRAGLPELREVARYAGVLTWFIGPLADGDSYLSWADLAAREGS